MNKININEQNLKILMIDDDKHFLEIFKAKLEKKGFKVCSALNGREGLKLATKERPAIITLDIMMPDINGFEALKELKNSKETNKIPVVMLSTASSKDVISKALAEGAIDYLIKAHTTPKDLVNKIKLILGLTQA